MSAKSLQTSPPKFKNCKNVAILPEECGYIPGRTLYIAGKGAVIFCNENSGLLKLESPPKKITLSADNSSPYWEMVSIGTKLYTEIVWVHCSP
jgi:hypothetical protein